MGLWRSEALRISFDVPARKDKGAPKRFAGPKKDWGGAKENQKRRCEERKPLKPLKPLRLGQKLSIRGAHNFFAYYSVNERCL